MRELYGFLGATLAIAVFGVLAVISFYHPKCLLGMMALGFLCFVGLLIGAGGYDAGVALYRFFQRHK